MQLNFNFAKLTTITTTINDTTQYSTYSIHVIYFCQSLFSF